MSASVEGVIERVEGFEVELLEDVEQYKYKRRAPGNLTVSQWRRQRLKDVDASSVIVYDGNENEVHGRMTLNNLRATYL